MAATLERVERATARPAPPRTGGALVLLAIPALAVIVGGAVLAPSVTDDTVARAILLGLWAVAGIALTIRRRGEVFGALVLGAVVVAGLEFIGASLAADPATGSDDLAQLARWIGLGAMPGLGLHLLIALPDGRVKRTSRRALVGAVYAACLIAGLASWVARPSPLWPIGVLGGIAFLIGAIVSNARYRRARGLDRQRMQWFGVAVTLGLAVAVVAGALHLLVAWPDQITYVVVAVVGWLPVSLIAGASSRFVTSVDRLLEATVSFAGLVGLIASVYLVVVLGLGRVPSEDERTLLVLSMAAALVTALLFPTTRTRLNDFATHLVYGEQHAPDEVLRTFGSRMSRAVPMDELLLQAAESLRKTFGLDVIEIWTGQAGRLERTVSLPERGRARLRVGEKALPVMARAGVTGRAWLRVWLPEILPDRDDSMVRLAPVAHQGEVLGAILVERFNSSDVFSDEEEQVLTDLARTIGVALHNVQLDSALQETLDEVRRQAEDLRMSRQRVVKAGDEARKKLQGDLHDGAQQHVVALAVKTKLIKTIMESDLDTAKAMLDDLGNDINEAVQQLRNFSHGIYPPILTNMGLVPALESVAGRSAIPTTVVAGEVERFAPELEAAVYFCCLEALTNAGKHAGEGASATITVRSEDGVLRFEVADDGAGFDLDAKGLGVGFINMQDRVGAAGGTIEVSSTPGEGTVVRGRVPLRS